ncbi:MAG: hypothetical protein GF307_02645 [candidate division Zixibacteria bacterium]|nr:hypothetical protein [candidate division Zixibacteria bacterium]
MKTLSILFALIILFLPSGAFAVVQAFDTPNDGGLSITIQWDTAAYSNSSGEYYEAQIARRAASESGWQDIAVAPASAGEYIDNTVEDYTDYVYRLVFTDKVSGSLIYDTEPVHSSPQYFNTRRTNVLIGIVVCLGVLIFFIYRGKKGKEMYVRPIAGLLAIEEAVGRATELGKPILYSAGRGGMQRVATIASMNILNTVAKKTAEYNIPLIFPNNDPVVAALAQEVVKESYSEVGHPDRYVEDDIFYLTDSQFGYAAAVDGIMVRRQPATNLFMGTFEAESLILAETGNSIGAIQIAGTDSTIQLSFFIVACDYVLIGEEYFAASGYLSKDPMVLSSLKGQDLLKVAIGIILAIGVLLATAGYTGFLELFNIG